MDEYTLNGATVHAPGLWVDPERLRAAGAVARQAAERLRGFDLTELDPTGREVGHAELAGALAVSAAVRRDELGGLVRQLDAVADRLAATADSVASMDHDLADRISTGHSGLDTGLGTGGHHGRAGHHNGYPGGGPGGYAGGGWVR